MTRPQPHRWLACADTIEAVHFLKAAFRKGKPLGNFVDAVFPTRCVPDKSKRYLYLKEAQRHRSLLPNRYKFFVCKQLRQGLEAGDVFCRDSVRFRSFKDDLVDDHEWKDKEKLIAETGLSLLKQPIREHLAELEEQLESRIAEVNRRIAAGENEHFAFIRHGRHARWTLRYPCESELLNHPFFDQLKQVEISSILHFVTLPSHKGAKERSDQALKRVGRRNRENRFKNYDILMGSILKCARGCPTAYRRKAGK